MKKEKKGIKTLYVNSINYLEQREHVLNYKGRYLLVIRKVLDSRRELARVRGFINPGSTREAEGKLVSDVEEVPECQEQKITEFLRFRGFKGNIYFAR